MKTHIAILFLTCAIISAQADLVLKQKIESPNIKGILVCKIKGNKIRVDMPDSPDGSVSTISDGSTGEVITLMHKQKQVYIVSREQWMKHTPNLAKDSGKSEKVGKYNAEIYTWFDPHGITNTLWVAKDFPNFPKLKEQFSKLKKCLMASGWADLPGMIVKTQIITNGHLTTVDLLSVSEEPIESRVFEVPMDYERTSELKYPKDFEKSMILTNKPN